MPRPIFSSEVGVARMQVHRQVQQQVPLAGTLCLHRRLQGQLGMLQYRLDAIMTTTIFILF